MEKDVKQKLYSVDGKVNHTSLEKKKVCQMLPIKQNKYVLVKRKQCTLWKKICVSKKGCKISKLKTFWEGKKNYYKKSKKMCNEKFIKKI